MKKYISRISNKIAQKLHRRTVNKRLERGQVLIIVTLSVIALVAIVGLVVDVGLLYLNHGKLRRSIDAAALAASLQFREGYSETELSDAAIEFLVLNGVNDPSATVETCATNPGDPVLCTTPARKLVRVRASSTMPLAFLPVIGIHETTVRASAVSEAASMDVVFVIDASDSMTYAATDPNDPMRDPSQCNPVHNCHPFEEVKDAALAFVDQLYFPYDRVAVVTFDDGARTDLGFSDNKADVQNAITNLEVIEPDICDTTSGPCRQYARDGLGDIIDLDGNGVGDTYLGFDCPIYHRTGNPDTCGTTSIGRGLLMAGDEFSNEDTFRQESLWVVILLTDGATNGPSYTCPNSTWTKPFCRDNNATTRHCFEADDESCLARGGVFDPDDYDTDDYARDMVDFVSEDQGALIFTIGLGQLVQTSIPIDSNGWGAGEQLLRYAADVGGGKYYFAPSGNQLRAIFLDIASNLATRLTQ